MLRPRDREYAGAVAGLLMAAEVHRHGLEAASSEDKVTAVASLAVRIVKAIDRHLPPKER